MWYRKKLTSTQKFLAQHLKDKENLKALGEDGSLHEVLKELTNVYLVCNDCF